MVAKPGHVVTPENVEQESKDAGLIGKGKIEALKSAIEALIPWHGRGNPTLRRVRGELAAQEKSLERVGGGPETGT